MKANNLKESPLFSPTWGEGAYPYAGLINVNGVLYGTTYNGGLNGDGAVFSITTVGQETVLYSFGGTGVYDANPRGSLVYVKGLLYGTTVYGGANGDGTVFKISLQGKEAVLHSFTGADGANPAAGLTNVNGVLYGTTYAGGANNDGTVFSITTSGTQTVLHSFAGTDGANSYAGLTSVKGALYGTTENGGANGDGTVFKVTTSGTETVLHSFAGRSDGANPYAGLTSVKGTLYGTTYAGASGNGTVFQIATSGSGFKMLYYFAGGTSDGANPQGNLIALSGALFGTTMHGGASGDGAVFEVLPGFYGAEYLLYSFAGSPDDGANPAAGLTNLKGTLYGTTAYGGGSGDGTVYALCAQPVCFNGGL